MAEEDFVSNGVVLEEAMWYELKILKSNLESINHRIQNIEKLIENYKANRNALLPHLIEKVWGGRNFNE